MATVRAMTKTELQAKYEALLHNCNLVETERDALRVKLDSRTQELISLNEAYSRITTRLDVAEHLVQALRQEDADRETEALRRPEPPRTKPVAALISERRAAMQRAREEAMATGRYVKV